MRRLNQRPFEQYRPAWPTARRYAAFGLQADRQRRQFTDIAVGRGQPNHRVSAEHAQRLRRSTRRQGPQFQRLVSLLAKSPYPLEQEPAIFGIEGHQHGGLSLVVGQHRHVLNLGRGGKLGCELLHLPAQARVQVQARDQRDHRR